MHKTSGFSLVELSIVLVILGLLVGGVLSGQSLIHAAELRAVTEEAEQYQTLVNTFRSKYNALPGDMNNAAQFWGEAATNCTFVPGTATGTQTCDGDRDGMVDNTHEQFTFWQHLSNAGLLDKSLDGIAADTTAYSVDENHPSSRFNGASWSARWYGGISGTANEFNGNYNHALFFAGGHSGTGSASATYHVLSPEDAWNIDTKVDDGMPATGSVVATRTAARDCTALSDGSDPAATDLDADYRLSNTAVSCALYFRNAF